MKKWILSIVSVAYFVVSCGMVINFHYCMDRLASTSFFGSQDKKCDQCGMDIHASDGCCRDEMQVLKMDEDQLPYYAATYTIPSMEDWSAVPSTFIATSTYNVSEQRHYHNHSPPLLSEQDRYLQHNVFRI